MVVVFIVVIQVPYINKACEFYIHEGVMGVIPARLDRGAVHLAVRLRSFEGWFAFN
jgi:hypothetical protein